VSFHPLTECDRREAAFFDASFAFFHYAKLDLFGIAFLVDGTRLTEGAAHRCLATAGREESAVLLDGAAAGVGDVVGHVGEGYLGAFNIVEWDLEAGLGDTSFFGAHPSPHDRVEICWLNYLVVEDLRVDDDELAERVAGEDFERHCWLK